MTERRAFPIDHRRRVEVDDLDTSEAAVLALDASKAAEQLAPADYRVYFGPAGHSFCTVRVGAPA